MHANMAMVEWWILAQSNWLMGHSGTSFSDSAAGVGLSPLGVMERMDLVHGMNHASTSMRRDWDRDSCSVVGAANPQHAETCPNRKGENEEARSKEGSCIYLVISHHKYFNISHILLFNI